MKIDDGSRSMPDRDSSHLIDLINEALKLAQAERRATLVYLLGMAADKARREADAIPEAKHNSERRSLFSRKKG
jgi:hypothetical protein